jgi:hypothetical protein
MLSASTAVLISGCSSLKFFDDENNPGFVPKIFGKKNTKEKEKTEEPTAPVETATAETLSPEPVLLTTAESVSEPVILETVTTASAPVSQSEPTSSDDAFIIVEESTRNVFANAVAESDAAKPSDKEELARLMPASFSAAASLPDTAGDTEPAQNTDDPVPPPQPLRPNDVLALNDWYDRQDRRRPGQYEPTGENPEIDPGAVPPPQPSEWAGAPPPVPDRWRLAQDLGIVENKWWDPYGQNFYKGDIPIKGTKDWFFAGSVISDTVIEPRSFPIPVGIQTTEQSGALDVFGSADAFVGAQTIIASAAFIKGSTAYKPQDLEFRATVAAQYNYAEVDEKRVLFVEPTKGTEREDTFVGLQEAFVDYHIRNVSERYDFDSVRVGIQPFSTDFRGFLFQDNQLGVRFFGNRDNNRWQYNLGAFARIEKDTNSGLNDITQDIRDDYMLVANLYRQDLPFPGMTSQATIVHNINREKDDVEIDQNGFPVRPALLGNLRGRDYDVTYLGYNADGRAGRLNLTASFYAALGKNEDSIFTGEETDIRAFFAAVEPSIDYDWMRFRLSGLYASGDSDPYDDEENGFDAIFENPQFAGADTSYWIRQTIPYAGGGRVISLSGRNGVLNSLQSSKEQGQSNFANPGTVLIGAGADFDITPPLRISFNANHLWFDDTSSLEALRVQGDIADDIGWDVSTAVIYRPNFIQNFVFRLSGAALVPGEGFEDLFENDDRDDYYYSILFNGVLTY